VNVIVGTGVAAVRAVEAFREAGGSAPIVMIGAEPELPYDRPPLSKEFLRGETTLDDARIHDDAFYRDNDVVLVRGVRATRLDTRDRVVELEDGRHIPFTKLLIATGSAPRRLGIPGEQLANVLSLRTGIDAQGLKTNLEKAARIVVVGGGLIGLEVGSVARAAGKQVTIIEAARQPLARLLHGEQVASAVADLHREHGSEVRTSMTLRELRGSGRVEEVVLSTGERIAADVVIVAVGIVPSTDWLLGSGLRLDDGVVVDAELRADVADVFAAGDVARALQPSGRHVRFEQYGIACEQGIVAGRAMAGVVGRPSTLPGAGSEQFGIRMQVIGATGDAGQVVVRGSLAHRSFVAFFLRDGTVHGAFVMDRAREVPAVRELVTQRARIDERRIADEGQPVGAAVNSL
jgi:3-phenylpropionate/trans-cinnamate dioxygenase ferredoxin reductase subunit